MKWKQSVLGALAASVSLGSALAADLPRFKEPPPPPPPAFTWTGWHVGLNAGYGGGSIDAVNEFWGFGFAGLNRWTQQSSSGFIGGVQHGYLWQLPSNLVIGYESDYQYSDVRSNWNNNGLGFNGPSQRLSWFGTERLRLGYAMGRFLPYVTGGLIYGRIRAQQWQVGGGFLFPYNSSATHAGWTVGGGFEYALWGNLSVKAEYLYAQMQGANGATLGVPLAAGVAPVLVNYRTPTFSTHIGRVGLNYTIDLDRLIGLRGL